MKEKHSTPSHDRQLETRPLSQLTFHPLHVEFYMDHSAQEIRELAQDLATNSQLMPIEILRNGQIICGRKRFLAMSELGWEEAVVWVRSDLEALGEEAITQRLIEDNKNRKHLTLLERIRCCLFELEHERELRKLGKAPQIEGDFRDWAAKRFHISGRTFDRLVRIIQQTPREVQDALALNLLTQGIAEKVAGLRFDKDKEAVAEIIRELRDEAGEMEPGELSEAMERELKAALRRINGADPAYRAPIRPFMKAVRKIVGLEKDVEGLEDEDWRHHEARMQEAYEVLGKLIRKGRRSNAA